LKKKSPRKIDMNSPVLGIASKKRPTEFGYIPQGMESCVIGVASNSQETRIILSEIKVIKHLMKTQKMTLEEAKEWYDYNTFGATGGKGAPLFFSSKDECPALMDALEWLKKNG
jgi:hypothetical protein